MVLSVGGSDDEARVGTAARPTCCSKAAGALRARLGQARPAWVWMTQHPPFMLEEGDKWMVGHDQLQGRHCLGLTDDIVHCATKDQSWTSTITGVA
jgi:hypothetical protein